MTCESVQQRLSLYLYGELNFDEEESVEAHLAHCAPCQERLQQEKRWHAALLREASLAPADLLVSCRHNIALELGAARAPFWSRWKEVLAPAAWGKPAGAFALLAIGFGLAHLPLRDAAKPAAPVASRVRVVEPEQDGRIRIVLEETRERTLMGQPDEARIRQLLLAASQDPHDPALRFDSVDILKSRSNAAEVRLSLLKTLQSDPNAGVRMKALEGLKPHAQEPDVQHALTQVLLSDKEAGVRALAIDVLTQQRGPEMVGVLQELVRHEQSGYVRDRCQRVLHDLGASVETF